ncbi:GSCOCG00011256001-RA-CDS, partial [Cotesia congregata]
GQKKVPLCKPFTICTTDGYIVDMLGPYYANQNDATIMRDIIDNPDGICLLLEPGDAFVVDRGFCDVKEYLESKNYKVLMPALKEKRNQLTTAESNASRYVTKLRWSVKATHGMLKQKYHLLDQRIDNKMLPRIGNFFKIVSFLHNMYSKRLTSDSEILDEVVETMK